MNRHSRPVDQLRPAPAAAVKRARKVRKDPRGVLVRVAIAPGAQLSFPRANQNELAAFDPSTKECTMNCGPHVADPRTAKERKLLCGDCLVARS